ncbi:peptidoglycan-binding domain-containing protein [Streptomyces sp. NPDC051940]|uniref:peptidoglycan-binding domain-containing protein n=1 Tax=Streptomyces sp. NPDC051940 TaxID=3155675 RepID=UPI003430E85B
MSRIRWGSRALIAGAVAAATLFSLSGTAQASTTVVDGSGALTDDFADHFAELGNSLCNGCGDSSNTDLVLMWQAVLYSEGYLTKSGLDGRFGSGTATATKKWQLKAGLTADGKVGNATWGKADGRLYWSKTSSGSWYVKYNAVNGSGVVTFVRGKRVYGSTGNYYLIGARNGSGTAAKSTRTTSTINLFSRDISLI